jgi:hypothetical protein
LEKLVAQASLASNPGEGFRKWSPAHKPRCGRS